MTKNNATQAEQFEDQLFKAADKLRKNIDAAEYKHIVLGLIFLKYISDSFEELHVKLHEGKGNYARADPEDQDEYKAENVFWVPPNARWTHIQSQARQSTIGKILDQSMEAIERENKTLKGILPKVFSRPNIASTTLGELIDLTSNIALGNEAAKSKDILGKVYEYFLGQFALAEGKKGGQFYTPGSIVKVLVEMIMGHIKRDDLSSSIVLTPTDSELEKMGKKIMPMFEKNILNIKQIHSLENLRDTLLPKLMSGKVRMKTLRFKDNE